MYTILIVDDSPMIVDVFVAMLERGGIVLLQHTVGMNVWKS